MKHLIVALLFIGFAGVVMAEDISPAELKVSDQKVDDAYLKPENKIKLVDLYVKMTGYPRELAKERCERLAEHYDIEYKMSQLDDHSTDIEATPDEQKVINEYLKPTNKFNLLMLYQKVLNVNEAAAVPHVLKIANIPTVNKRSDELDEEGKANDAKVIEAFLKPKNKEMIYTLYVKLTGYPKEVAIDRSQQIALENMAVKDKWNTLQDENKGKTNTKQAKLAECKDLLAQAEKAHSAVDYKQHEKCEKYQNQDNFAKYSQRKDFKKTIETCFTTEQEYSDKDSEFWSLMNKSNTCSAEFKAM